VAFPQKSESCHLDHALHFCKAFLFVFEMWLSLVVSEGKTVDNCFDRAKAQSKEPKKQSVIATHGDYATACKLRNARSEN